MSPIKNYLKLFYNISNFETEILNWSFSVDVNQNNIVIGHPKNSHKGTSLGDILPYTRLPYELKQKYPNKKIFVPEWFSQVFTDNPYIDGISNDCCRWGSLGPFGTTVQRTTNVWGVKTKFFTPIVYTKLKTTNRIIICVRSKTGGEIKNIEYLTNEILKLKPNYKLIQIGMKDDQIIPNLDEYCFNLTYSQLVSEFSKSLAYIGVQNSLYHLAKAVGLKIVGILPENVDPYFVKLPLLTQCNHNEIEMLSNKEKERPLKWKQKIERFGKNPSSSHHIGWLYPDTPHLTMRQENPNPFFCPSVSYLIIKDALEDRIYPFNNAKIYDYYSFPEDWIGG